MPTFLATIIQSTLLKSAANLIVQVISQWQAKNGPRKGIDWQRVLEFAIFGIIQAQLNWWWQQFLEDSLPSYSAAPINSNKEKQKQKESAANGRSPLVSTLPPPRRSINKTNVALKLLLDMTVGLIMMNSLFVVCTTAARLRSVSLVWQAFQQKILGVLFAAWKLWPIVSISNFLWVPVESRVLVSSFIGFGWNMFLAFKTLVD